MWMRPRWFAAGHNHEGRLRIFINFSTGSAILSRRRTKYSLYLLQAISVKIQQIHDIKMKHLSSTCQAPSLYHYSAHSNMEQTKTAPMSRDSKGLKKYIMHINSFGGRGRSSRCCGLVFVCIFSWLGW